MIDERESEKIGLDSESGNPSDDRCRKKSRANEALPCGMPAAQNTVATLLSLIMMSRNLPLLVESGAYGSKSFTKRKAAGALDGDNKISRAKTDSQKHQLAQDDRERLFGKLMVIIRHRGLVHTGSVRIGHGRSVAQA